MKTTLDLPADLLDVVKQRALREGRRLTDIAVELMRRGLSDTVPIERQRKTKIVINSDGVPVVHCTAHSPASKMTAEALIALEQETLSREDVQRLGLAL